MSGLILPARMTRQPQSPTSISDEWRRKKLRVVYLPLSLTPADLSGNGRNVTDTTCTSTVQIDSVGKVWDFGTGSATSRIKLPALAINGVGGVTWLARVYATNVANCVIANCDSGDAGTAANGVALRTNAGVLEILLPGLAIPATGPTITTGRWYTIAMRYMAGNGSSGCAATFAVDGVLTAGAALDNTAPSNDLGAIPYIGAQSANFRNWQGKIALFANFDSLLSDADLRSVTQNPWQIFKAPARRLWIGASASSGISGDSSQTLADVTTAAAAALQIKADSAVTLANVTTAGATNLAIAAAGSKTLDDVTSSAAGAVQIKADSAVTLENVSTAGAGVVGNTITGAVAVTLADVTGSGTATLALQAASNVTLADVSTAGATTLYLVAAGSKTLDDVTSSATGALRNTGAVSVTLANVTTSAAGAAEVPAVYQASPTTSLTRRVTTPRLGYASDSIRGNRLGHTIHTVAARRLGAKNT